MKNIREIRRINFNKLSEKFSSQREFSDALDTTAGYVNQLLTGHRPIGEKSARNIESKLGLDIFYLDIDLAEGETINPTRPALITENKIESNAIWYGEFDLWDSSTPLRDDEVALPFFREVKLSAGKGISEVQENHGAKLRFAKSTLKRKGISAANAACVVVSGNSMEPVLPDGSTIGIDTSKTDIINGKMYAIDHDGQLRVKMIYNLPGGGLRLRSFNTEEWPDEPYSDTSKIRILGQVFWSSVLW